MRILGIDPGLGITGYGVIEVIENSLRLLTFGIIKTSKKQNFTDKLFQINQKICDIIGQFSPDYFAVEDIFYHLNKKTAIVMGHARAVAMLAAAQYKIAVYEYSPREVKMSIVGSGSASKVQVQAMVKNILKLSEVPKPEDASDAIAVALCHYHRLKFQQISKGLKKL